jgi:uncharacterized protein YdaU (DUF1376 family)
MNEDKKIRKAPAFQFYADDFLAGTSDMSAEEVGGYIRLLCHQWTKGGIPNDEERVARIAGMIGSPSVGYVMAKFRLCDGHTLKNERLEKVREEQQAFKARQSTAGTNGAAKRWKKWPDDVDPNGVAIATPMAAPWPEHSQTIAGPMAGAWPEDSSPSPSPTPNKKDTAAPKSPWDVGFGVELPNSFQTENCLQAVKLWLQHKAEKKKSYKKTGLTAALTKWSNEFSPDEFPRIVEYSIASNWDGIFPPKQTQQPSLPINSNGSANLSMDISQYQ